MAINSEDENGIFKTAFRFHTPNFILGETDLIQRERASIHLNVDFFPFTNFYWNIANVQCCVSLGCTTKWFSYTYKYMFFLLWCSRYIVLTPLWPHGLIAYSLPGCSVHQTSQARKLEWVAISFSSGSSRPRDQAWVSCTDRKILYSWATWRKTWQPFQYSCLRNSMAICRNVDLGGLQSMGSQEIRTWLTD